MKKFYKTGDAVGSLRVKTTDFIRNIDYKMNIGRMEEEIEEIYLDIGEMVCRYLDSGQEISLTGPVKERYRRICSLKKNILTKQKAIHAKTQGVKYCDRCHEVFDDDSVFCSICGKKL